MSKIKWYDEKNRKGEYKYKVLREYLPQEVLKDFRKLKIEHLNLIPTYSDDKNKLTRFNLSILEYKKIYASARKFAIQRVEAFKGSEFAKQGRTTQAYAQKDVFEEENWKNQFTIKKDTFPEYKTKVSHMLNLLSSKTSTLEGYEKVMLEFKERIHKKLQEILSKEEYDNITKSMTKEDYNDFWRYYNKLTEDKTVSPYDSENVQAIAYRAYKGGVDISNVKNYITGKVADIYEKSVRTEDDEREKDFFNKAFKKRGK